MISQTSSQKYIGEYYIHESSTANDNLFQSFFEETDIGEEQIYPLSGTENENCYESMKYSEQTAGINKNKIQENINPYRENNLPDWVYAKAKKAFGIREDISGKSYRGSDTLVKSGDATFKNTQLAWMTMMIIGNAVTLSGGEKNMKINEENLDWNKVFEVTKAGF